MHRESGCTGGVALPHHNNAPRDTGRSLPYPHNPPPTPTHTHHRCNVREDGLSPPGDRRLPPPPSCSPPPPPPRPARHCHRHRHRHRGPLRADRRPPPRVRVPRRYCRGGRVRSSEPGGGMPEAVRLLPLQRHGGTVPPGPALLRSRIERQPQRDRSGSEHRLHRRSRGCRGEGGLSHPRP